MPRSKRHPYELWKLIINSKGELYTTDLFKKAEEKKIGHSTFYRLLKDLKEIGAIEIKEEKDDSGKIRKRIIPKLPRNMDSIWKNKPEVLFFPIVEEVFGVQNQDTLNFLKRLIKESPVFNRENVIIYLAKSKKWFYSNDLDFKELIDMLDKSRRMRICLLKPDLTLEVNVLNLFHRFLKEEAKYYSHKINEKLQDLLQLSIYVLPPSIKRKILFKYSLRQDLLDQGKRPLGVFIEDMPRTFGNGYPEFQEIEEKTNKSLVRDIEHLIDWIDSDPERFQSLINITKGIPISKIKKVKILPRHELPEDIL